LQYDFKVKEQHLQIQKPNLRIWLKEQFNVFVKIVIRDEVSILILEHNLSFVAVSFKTGHL